MVAFLAGQIWNLVVSRFNYWFRYELWNVGVCREPIEAALARGRLNGVSWAPSLGRRRFIADPFAIQTATGVTVYVEDLDFAAAGKGRIARFALTESWNGWRLEEALETQEHLSYPFLFEAEDQVWCVPESHEARACQLYRVAVDGTLRMEAVILEKAEFVTRPCSSTTVGGGRFAPIVPRVMASSFTLTTRGTFGVPGRRTHLTLSSATSPRRARPAHRSCSMALCAGQRKTARVGTAAPWSCIK